jgi:hypothetical protein
MKIESVRVVRERLSEMIWTFVSEDPAATLPISWAAERAPRRD